MNDKNNLEGMGKKQKANNKKYNNFILFERSLLILLLWMQPGKIRTKNYFVYRQIDLGIEIDWDLKIRLLPLRQLEDSPSMVVEQRNNRIHNLLFKTRSECSKLLRLFENILPLFRMLRHDFFYYLCTFAISTIKSCYFVAFVTS